METFLIGGGLLYLLSQMGKGAGTPQSPNSLPTNLTTLFHNQIAAVPVTKVITPVSSAAEFAQKNPGLLISLGVTALTAAIAAPVAAILVLIVAEAAVAAGVFISSAVKNTEWEYAATAKGSAGLLTDYTTVGVNLAQSTAQALASMGAPAGSPPALVQAWPVIARLWSAQYAAAIMTGYNEVSYGCICFWQQTVLGDPNGGFYWHNRAMYLDPSEVERMRTNIIHSSLSPAELNMLPQLGAALTQADAWGKQLGRILWAYMAARKSMFEPWQYDWFSAGGVGSATGVSVGGGAGLGGWADRWGANMMLGAISCTNPNWVSPPPLGLIYNLDQNGQWVNPGNLNPYAWSLGAQSVSKTVAYPFVVDWAASSDTNFAVTTATAAQAPQRGMYPGFSQFLGGAGRRFARMTRGRYG